MSIYSQFKWIDCLIFKNDIGKLFVLDGMYIGYIVGDDDDSLFDSEFDEVWRDFLNI